ncbi:TetR/AcrR family transcriptional regulator, partial [Acidovorax cavernicola]
MNPFLHSADAVDEEPLWPATQHSAQQREAKRQAVLSAAAQLFNERGFHATSLDDIAARLGVSKPTLYYYV